MVKLHIYSGAWSCDYFGAYGSHSLIRRLQCLAAQKATGSTAEVLTNLFGGATNNEGLGLFSISLDWQYVRNLAVDLPSCF
jgi:hypothetical protein